MNTYILFYRSRIHINVYLYKIPFTKLNDPYIYVSKTIDSLLENEVGSDCFLFNEINSIINIESECILPSNY